MDGSLNIPLAKKTPAGRRHLTLCPLGPVLTGGRRGEQEVATGPWLPTALIGGENGKHDRFQGGEYGFKSALSVFSRVVTESGVSFDSISPLNCRARIVYRIRYI